MGYSPWGCKELDVTERAGMQQHGRPSVVCAQKEAA